jgi:hypothetical protein
MSWVGKPGTAKTESQKGKIITTRNNISQKTTEMSMSLAVLALYVLHKQLSIHAAE